MLTWSQFHLVPCFWTKLSGFTSFYSKKLKLETLRDRWMLAWCVTFCYVLFLLHQYHVTNAVFPEFYFLISTHLCVNGIHAIIEFWHIISTLIFMCISYILHHIMDSLYNFGIVLWQGKLNSPLGFNSFITPFFMLICMS